MAAKKKASRGSEAPREPGRAKRAAGGSARAGQASAGQGPGDFQPKGTPRRTARTCRPEELRKKEYTGEQRLLLLDMWLRSQLPAKDFCSLVGVSKHTLYVWKRNFDRSGPAGLMGHRQVRRGSRLPEVTRRAILMMKEAHPDWGSERLQDMLLRAQDLEASPQAIQRVLREAGYVVKPARTTRNPPKPTRFEAPAPSKLWQSDIFSFLLKRQRRRISLVAFMDDHSRFIVGWDLAAGASAEWVCGTFHDAVANFGAPEELLTDRGGQYHAWRGKSKLRKLCDRLGVEQRLSRPRHPQTLGKIERFWGTLFRELIDVQLIRDLDDARERIGHFIAYYNFQRTHQGIGGLVPADRFFAASEEVRKTLEARVATNARELALHGQPRKAMYLTGRVGDKPVTLHTEGSRLFLTDAEGVQEAVDLRHPGRRAPGPGESELDAVIEELGALESNEAARRQEEEHDAEGQGEQGDEGQPGGEAGDAGDPGGALGPDDDE